MGKSGEWDSLGSFGPGPGPARGQSSLSGLGRAGPGWAGLVRAGRGDARSRGQAGGRAGRGAEARPHKGASSATGAALSWVGFVKSWPVSRKRSSRPTLEWDPI